MSQNRSAAVMQQRSEPHDSLDDFPTPPWATRALCERLGDLSDLVCREPAANRGHMVGPLREYFGSVIGSDIHDYGAGFPVFDFVGMEIASEVDWTITNPPFRLAEAFIQRALETSRVGVAVIVRSAFLEGIARYQNLFSVHPPSRVMQFVERAPMVRGRIDASAVSATAYSWLVWTKPLDGVSHLEWIPPCRKRLERKSDYPVDILPAVTGGLL